MPARMGCCGVLPDFRMISVNLRRLAVSKGCNLSQFETRVPIYGKRGITGAVNKKPPVI